MVLDSIPAPPPTVARFNYVNYTEQSTREMNGSSGVKGQKCTVMGAEINVDEYGKRQGGGKNYTGKYVYDIISIQYI